MLKKNMLCLVWVERTQEIPHINTDHGPPFLFPSVGRRGNEQISDLSFTLFAENTEDSISGGPRLQHEVLQVIPSVCGPC